MIFKRNDILFWTGIITAIWFAWTEMIWAYSACLIIAYPVGLISFFIWAKLNDNKRNKFIIVILIVGLMLSFSALIYPLIFD